LETKQFNISSVRSKATLIPFTRVSLAFGFDFSCFDDKSVNLTCDDGERVGNTLSLMKRIVGMVLLAISVSIYSQLPAVIHPNLPQELFK
jgi:hypothetical protein